MAPNDTLPAANPDGLRSALRAHSIADVDHHPLLEALATDATSRAGVCRVEYRSAAAGGVEVLVTLRGPGSLSSTLLDLEIGLGDLAVHTMRGGSFESAYPAEAFAARTRAIHPRVGNPLPERLSTIEFGSEHGCSSDAEVPAFLLSTLGGSQGLWFAVSWTGTWRAVLTKLRHRDAHRLTITGPGPILELVDDEELLLPSVVIGTYSGDGWAAIRDHFQAIAPSPSSPWVVYNTWFNENAAIDATRMLANLEVAREIGVEVMTLDGAWYETAGGDSEDFTTVGIGTWTPDPTRFPDGLEPIAEAVISAGLRFGLWCEIERAHPGSAVAKSHPDWLRSVDGEKLALLELGRAEVVDWCVAQLSSMIDRWQLSWLKLDMTTHAVSAYWDGEPRAEIDHIRGLYRMLDEVRRRHPGLVIEGCAGGGTRIDREMVARCDTFWLSDQTQSPDLVRATVANARALLPAQYCYLSVSPGLPEPVNSFPDGWLLGVMPGVFGLMDTLRNWPAELRDQVAVFIDTYKRIRHLLDGRTTRFNVRPEASLLSEWDALEVTGEAGAVLFAHRLLSPDPTRVFDGERRWTVTVEQSGGACLEIK